MANPLLVPDVTTPGTVRLQTVSRLMQSTHRGCPGVEVRVDPARRMGHHATEWPWSSSDGGAEPSPMREREGRLALVGLLALALMQAQAACASARRPDDCGQGGTTGLAAAGSMVTFACDLEPRGRYYNRDLFSISLS